MRVLNRYPHDTNAFTQGLVMSPRGDTYYESSGRYGSSTLREVQLTTGKTLRTYRLPKTQFAEGITLLPDGRIIQLTWKERVIHIYSSNFTVGPSASISWPREGWGVTLLRDQLVVSDGTAMLYFLSSIAPYQLQRTVQVRTLANNHWRPVFRLNELETVEGEIYANIWLERRIAVIDPASGIVKRWLDLSSLPVVSTNSEAVLNGIAYDSTRKRLFVTGKLWPWVYEIEP